MGVVYRGRAPDGTPVAIKMLHANVAVDSIGARFLQEGALRIEHPNVVRVIDAGSANGSPYLVLEMLEGEPLDARLARGPLPWTDAVSIGVQACRGLEVVHARGI